MTRLLISLAMAVIVAAAAMFAITSYSDAQEPTSCPDGTVLSADGSACLSEAVNDNVVVTRSCTQGVLSDDGQFCIVPRLDEPAPPTPLNEPSPSTPDDAPVPSFTG